jgi:hypothetical protein
MKVYELCFDINSVKRIARFYSNFNLKPDPTIVERMDAKFEDVLDRAVSHINIEEAGWDQRLKNILDFTRPINNYGRSHVVCQLFRRVMEENICLKFERAGWDENRLINTEKRLDEIFTDVMGNVTRRSTTEPLRLREKIEEILKNGTCPLSPSNHLQLRTVIKFLMMMITIVGGAFSYFKSNLFD